MESMAATGLTVESSTTCNRTLSELILVKIDLLLHHAVEKDNTVNFSFISIVSKLILV